MLVNKISNTFSFTSRNNPIPPETFISDAGEVTMCEASKKDMIKVAKLIHKLDCDMFKMCNEYKKDIDDTKKLFKSMKNKGLEHTIKYIDDILEKPDGNSSLLIAKNKKGKIIGYALLERLDEVKEKVGIINNIHLDFNYTKGNLGLYLLNKITQNGKNAFKHIVTKSPFIGGHEVYLDLDYKHLSPNTLIAEILNDKYTDKDYQGWMYKKLDYFT